MDSQAYREFLNQVLRAIVESKGDSQVVYRLLAANIEKLDNKLAQLLPRWWATDFLAGVETGASQYFTAVIGNFSNLIQEFPLGDKASNMEIAIAGHEIVLTVFTRDAFPQQWATTQYNVGIAYFDRIKGEKAQNLELAIAAFQNAISVRTRDAFPQDWASTQNNLGTAYLYRIKGEKAQNLELAIAAFQNAISVFTRDAFPQDWASTQNNLGAAYLYRILGSKAQNLELAIAAYQNAISVRTRDAFPQDWASTQNNLGNAYLYRILREKAQNLELAIAAYQNAISVFTRDAFPQDWAQTQNNLGIAYSNRILGSKAQNLELAIIAFQNAISVRTRDAFPQNHAETLLNLGIAYQDGKQYTLAHNTFESAIETVEFLRGEIGSGEESKRKQAEEWNQLYGRMVEVCLELGKDTQAIEYIERSKTRNLVELLAIRDLYPTGIISEDTRKQLQQLRKDIDIEKRRLAAEEQPNYTRINELRQRYNELYPFEFITFEQIQALLGLQTAIIQWYIFPDCFRVFIITRNHDKPIIWHSSAEDLEKLRNLTSYEYLKPYFEDKSRWRHDLNDKLQQLAKILHLDEIVALIPAQCKKIILIPHFYLHLLPLHALPLSKGEDFIDKFPQGVSYAPSCQLLQKLLVNKGGDTDFSIPTSESYSTPPVPINELAHLLAIQNPTGDLEFTDIEVETIAAAFHPRRILKKGEATKTALMQQPTAEQFRDAHWLHFSSHAQFNLTYPLQSRLQLAKSSADNETSDLEQDLTLEDILNLSLPNCRMVTLSACETGLIDISSIDEYIGLPSGFIRVGAATVVSSLWTVDDFSTALLMIKFYENLQTLTGNVAIALNQAQLWCRQATQSELWQWIDGKIDMDVQHKEKIQKRLQFYTPEQKPFKNASAWAAFCAIGQ
ncbi:MAG: CHAT domain-containing protein [Stigonema ocellatum SAG 48.90 = DSM 106950]|nr:CHAT domain-containing protein [Stigonema ocellatum SAG 48.90 = DSM 106950]